MKSTPSKLDVKSCSFNMAHLQYAPETNICVTKMAKIKIIKISDFPPNSCSFSFVALSDSQRRRNGSRDLAGAAKRSWRIFGDALPPPGIPGFLGEGFKRPWANGDFGIMGVIHLTVWCAYDSITMKALGTMDCWFHDTPRNSSW